MHLRSRNDVGPIFIQPNISWRYDRVRTARGCQLTRGGFMQPNKAVVAHFGRLGMKWGVRHTPAELASMPPAHSEDAQRHQESLKKVVAGGTHALSDKDFKALVNRLQMQQQYTDLLAKQKPKAAVARGHDAVKTVIGFAETGVKIYNLANSPAVKAGRDAFAKAHANK
jgi:hypothetical protein